MIEINDQGKLLSEERLADFERELKAKLPPQYRQFLLKFNGGRPFPDIIDIGDFPGSPTDVQEFFGIEATLEANDLSWNQKWLSDRIPSRWLPIATDSGGSIFCLSLSGDDAGKIIYVNLQFVGDQTQRVSYYIVAKDFDDFLSKIREWVDL